MKNLIKRANQIRKETIGKNAMNIVNGYENKPDYFIEQYTTKNKWTKYVNGEINREKVIDYAIKRMTERINKKYDEDLTKIANVKTATDFTEILILVEWKKSNLYGYNPTATVTVFNENNNRTYYGKASGYGYDKESAAIAEALNQSDSVLKMLYTAADQSEPEYYNSNKTDINYRNAIGYGSGYNYLPYFEGGAGVSCFSRIFETLGYSFKCTSNDKKFSVYVITKRA